MTHRGRSIVWVVLVCTTLTYVLIALGQLKNYAEQNRASATEARAAVAVLSQQVKRLGGKPAIDIEDLIEPGPAGPQGLPGLPGLSGEDGQDGVKGTNGVDGQDGEDGTDGTNGTDGLNGKDGTNGVDGQDGVDGKDGLPGADGATGAQGPQGAQGEPGPAGESALPFTFTFTIPARNPSEQDLTYRVTCTSTGCTTEEI